MILHWADKIAKELRDKKEKHVIATGITPSGPIHIGNVREIITADAIHRALGEDSKLIYIADTFDPLRKVYPFLPPDFERYVGVPLSEIPCPYGCCESYIHHFLNPFLEGIDRLNINPKVILAHELYKKGKYAPYVRKVLEESEKLRNILTKFTGRELPEDWFPYMPQCQTCKRITSTKIISLADDKIEYKCTYGHEGTASIKRGEGKLPWRVDWPARWKMLSVTCEPLGKDHAVSGGSYETGKAIVEEIFGGEAPYPVVYEWIHMKGIGVMSSSRGIVFSIKDWLDVAPPEALKYLILRSKTNKHIEFDPKDLPDLMDNFDSLWKKYHYGEASEEERRLAELCGMDKSKIMAVPYRFMSVVAQITDDFDYILRILRRTGHIKDDFDENLIKQRLFHCKNWVDTYAPEWIKFNLKEELPDIKLDEKQKKGLKILAESLDKDLDDVGMHNEIYRVAREEVDMDPKHLFQAIYLVLIGKKSGPKAGSFIISLEKNFVKKRFVEASMN
ncbi:MAG: lysine--tRNA ligase [Candidatus Hydrothermarchaeota archaeon]